MSSRVAADAGERLARRTLLPPLSWLLGLALILRVALIWYKGNRYYFADTTEYLEAARSILAGHGPGAAYTRAPLYPAFLSLGLRIGGPENYVALRLVQLLVGMGVVWLTVLLARRIGSRSRGHLAGLGAAIAPTLVFTSSMLYPTALYTLLLVTVILGVLSIEQRPGAWRSVLLGVSMALVLLTDTVVAITLAGLLLWLVLAGRRHGVKILACAAVAVLAAVLLLKPYEQWHERAYGSSGVPLMKLESQLYGIRAHPDLASGRRLRDTTRVFRLSARQLLAHEADLLRQQPGAYLGDYAREFLHFFAPLPDRLATRNVFTQSRARLLVALYFAMVIPLALIGLFAGAVRVRHRLLLAVPPLATAATYAFFFTQTRYRIPVEPPLLVLAALGLVRLWPRAFRARDAVADGSEHP